MRRWQHDKCRGGFQTRHNKRRSQFGQPQGVAPTLSLPDVVHRFKSLTTSRYRLGVTQKGWLTFPGRLWQRNYFEHIIRDENDLDEIREYIMNNPNKWDLDDENPRNINSENIKSS